MSMKRLRYADLLELSIVKNRVTLSNWIKDRDFPPGQLTGPNSRTWAQSEVEAWIANRPTAPRTVPQIKNRPGRPRKLAAIERSTS